MLKRFIDRLRSGLLNDVWTESKWIYGYTSRYRTGILSFILLGLFSTALGLISGIASKNLIDAVINHLDSVIVSAAVLYAVLGIGRIVLNSLVKYVNARISVRATNEIRADVFSRFLDTDWQASLNYHSGDLLSRVSSDVSTVAGSVLGWIPTLITTAVQFFATLAVIFYYDPMMAPITIIGAVFTALLSAFLLPKVRKFSKKVRETQADLTAFYEESLQNLQAIKSLHIKPRVKNRLEVLQDIYRNVSFEYNNFSVCSGALMSFAGFTVSCICLFWCSFRLWNGYISFGTLVLFLQLAGLVTSSFNNLVGLVPTIISATVSARRIMTILDLPSEDETISAEAASVIAASENNGVAVRIKDVCFTYNGGREVFDGLSLYANPGEVIGIVSPSGGGKTTLIRLLLSLISPDKGEILFECAGSSACAAPCLRPLMTSVAQEKSVFSGTIADFLQIGNDSATSDEIEQALRTACAWDFVSALPDGVYSMLGERGAGLSEGQIQRLSIAQALLSRAPVMLLDEATSALDMQTEQQLIHNLFLENIKRTVIVTTHRPTLLKVCTRVYTIESGSAKILSAKEIDDITCCI